MLKQLLEKIKDEGDFTAFTHKGYNLNIIRQQELGHLCGYVQIPKEHPFYQKEIYEIEKQCTEPIPAHGGLNFAQYNPDDEMFWIGFDCGHAGDISPFMEQLLFEHNPERFTILPSQTYRDMSYVRNNLIEIVNVIENSCI